MFILGIETSCDETALALIETRGDGGAFECRVITSLIHSQASLHSPYGGVFPMLAKREHEKYLPVLLEKILGSEVTSSRMQMKRSPVDAIAVTEGPGLEPALWTGITCAEDLGKKWSVPVIPVNHMEGHIVGSLLESDAPDGNWQGLKPLPLPSLALLISGGHTELVKIENNIADEKNGIGAPFRYTIIGATKDDAVGEAFDKAARLLGLPYPGGPQISNMAKKAREKGVQSPITLPRPMLHSADLNFSFSGLKTAVLYAVRDAEKSESFDDTSKQGLAREFEDAVAETLDTKLRTAIEETGAQSLIIGGGVSANDTLRDRFTATAMKYDLPIYLPSRHISGDNALMIALAGALNYAPKEKLHAHGTKKLGN